MAVDIDTRGTIPVAGIPKPLPISALVGFGFSYDVAADGQRFLVETESEQSAHPKITVVQNWAPGK